MMNELLLRRRVASMERGMIPIEYIANTGEAYINTGYVPQGLDIRIACKFYYGGFYRSVNFPSLVRAYVNDSTRCYRLMMRGQTNNIVFQNARRGDHSDQNMYALTVGKIYEVDFDHYNYTVNGVAYNHINYATSRENTIPLRFIDADNALNSRFYYFKLWKGADLMLDMIPVRIGQDGYFYDKVSGKLFGNAGTGDFILGPDK